MQALLLAMCLISSVQGQQDLFTVSRNLWQQYPNTSGGFQDRFTNFRIHPQTDLNFKESAGLGIKRVTLLDEHGNLMKQWELDSAGTGWAVYLPENKRQQRYGVKISYPYKNGNPADEVWHFFSGDTLLRIDSVLHRREEFGYKDSLCICEVRQTKRYKKGLLLNEQNQYYNSRYYFNGRYLMPGVFIFTTWNPNSPPAEEKFRTNYQPDEWFYCFLEEDYNSLNPCGQCNARDNKFGFREEMFQEPVWPVMSGGDMMPMVPEPYFGIKTDSTGLPSGVYLIKEGFIHLPPERSKEPDSLSQNKLNPGETVSGIAPVEEWKLVEIEKQLIYSFHYEFWRKH